MAQHAAASERHERETRRDARQMIAGTGARHGSRPAPDPRPSSARARRLPAQSAGLIRQPRDPRPLFYDRGRVAAGTQGGRRRASCAWRCSPSAIRERRPRTPAAERSRSCSRARATTWCARAIVKDEPSAVTAFVASAAGGRRAGRHHHRRHRHHVARFDLRGHRRAARETPRRIRRAVSHVELRGHRPGGDAEPRLRRARARRHRDRAARLRVGRATGDDEAGGAGTRRISCSRRPDSDAAIH